MTPLASLTTLKRATGEYPNPENPSPKDGQYTDALDAASTLIRAYTGLRFEIATGVTSDRNFEYDGSGYLDIDEAVLVVGVTQTAGYSWATPVPMTTDEWAAQPYNEPVKRWLRLPEVSYGMSPEMGFKWNLDTLYDRFPSRPNIVTVAADWGWPEIPADVQRAAIWTALGLLTSPKGYTQESIEGYSRTRASGDAAEAIPERAQIALMPYVLPRV